MKSYKLKGLSLRLPIFFTLFGFIHPLSLFAYEKEVAYIKQLRVTPSTILAVPFDLVSAGGTQSVMLNMGYAHGVTQFSAFLVVSEREDRSINFTVKRMGQIEEGYSGTTLTHHQDEKILQVLVKASSLDVWRETDRGNSIIRTQMLRKLSGGGWKSPTLRLVGEVRKDVQLEREYHTGRRWDRLFEVYKNQKKKKDKPNVNTAEPLIRFEVPAVELSRFRHHDSAVQSRIDKRLSSLAY